jgi:hypothetical protein
MWQFIVNNESNNKYLFIRIATHLCHQEKPILTATGAIV